MSFACYRLFTTSFPSHKHSFEDFPADLA